MFLDQSRKWCEFDRQNDAFWIGIRSLLVAFAAFNTQNEAFFLGTGFVIGITEEGYLITLTAKHVVESAAIQAQGLARERVASAASVFSTKSARV